MNILCLLLESSSMRRRRGARLCATERRQIGLGVGARAHIRGAGGPPQWRDEERVIQNELLAAMPRKAYEALAPALVPVTLVFGDVLYEADAAISHVYFPCQSMVSLLLPVEHHFDVEVGLVGREGMLGASL